MDLTSFRDLLTPAGQAALAAATALGPTDETFLPCFEKVRKEFPAELAKAAVTTAALRVRAAAKFSQADRMYFTREGLEQSSGEVAARHRAGRFAPFEAVADLGCGIGGDTLALASVVPAVEAVDADPLRLALAEANAKACGLADRVSFVQADILAMSLPRVAAFADPGRRADGRRFLGMNDYLPPPSAIRERFGANFPLAFKIAPGVAWRDLDGWDSEVEFVSVGGELKECVLWCGPLRTAGRRATVLPGPHTLAAEGPVTGRPPSDPRAFVLDPDPSVVRAGLEHQWAETVDAHPVDWSVAVFTADAPVSSPFADCYRVDHWAPFHLGRLRDYLREQKVGRVTMLKRASELDVNDITRKLRLDGPDHRHVILTRSLGRPVAVVGEKVG